MILTQETVKDNFYKGKKIVQTYERTTLAVETEQDMKDLLKQYTDAGWKLGFYDNKALQIGFEIEFNNDKFFGRSKKEKPITRERFYTAWNALVLIADKLVAGKDMVDEARKAIKKISTM